MSDTNQRCKITVATALGQQSLTCINKNHGHLGCRSTGHHVTRVLLMSGRISDDKLPLVCRKVSICDVYCNSLLSFGLETIEQERIVDFAFLGANFLTVSLKGSQLILVDQLGIPEQSSNQGTFAIIYTSACNKAQQGLFLLTFQVGINVVFN